MGYRKKKKTWKKAARYGNYFKKCTELAEVKQKRKELTINLNNLLGIKIQEYWDMAVIPELKNMRNEIEGLGEVPEKSKAVAVIRYCISFLDIVSRYQDTLDGGIKFSPLGKEAAVQKFNDDLTFAGRHKKDDRMNSASGIEIPFWNNTLKGENITEDNIFFGPDIGLPERPASYWLHLKKSKTVAITLTKNFEKGHITKKPILMWATAALVKYGTLYTFCKIGYKRFSETLEQILA